MVTTNNPKKREVGKSVANQLFVSLNHNNISIADVIFRDNEREAIGRRVLISILVLEGVTIREIAETLRCGQDTVVDAIKHLNAFDDKDKLLKFLRKVHKDQLPVYESSIVFRNKYPKLSYLFGFNKERASAKI